MLSHRLLYVPESQFLRAPAPLPDHSHAVTIWNKHRGILVKCFDTTITLDMFAFRGNEYELLPSSENGVHTVVRVQDAVVNAYKVSLCH